MKIDSSKYPLPARFRHHSSANQYLPLSELKTIPEYYPPLIKEIRWEKYFDNGMPPDVLDIGCGKGQFLLDFAELNPDLNILGIELRKGPVEWLDRIIKGEKIPNAAVLWYSVVNGLDFIGSETISKVFYLFPDPWFKKKHNKRRAFNEKFLDNIFRILRKDGELYLATDVSSINDYHLEILSSSKKFRYEIIQDDANWRFPRTNKEQFCLKKNIEYYRIKVYKNL